MESIAASPGAARGHTRLCRRAADSGRSRALTSCRSVWSGTSAAAAAAKGRSRAIDQTRRLNPHLLGAAAVPIFERHGVAVFERS
jgi:hypothetical protein